jgi:uncharacterized protein
MDIFIPDAYYQSIYKINYQKLKKRGVKCLLFDLDNTMAPYSKIEPDKKLKDLFAVLQSDFKVIILSNNNKNRLRPFKEKLNVDTAFSSKKPFKGKYKKILSMYHLKPGECAAVGDQLMTDILGANRMNMYSIFVNPLSEFEHPWTKINRFFERIIIKKLNQRGILIKGEYYE